MTGAGDPRATLSDRITPENRKNSVSSSRNHLSWFTRVLPADIVGAINTKTPYGISSLYVCGANPVLTFSNSQNTVTALKRVDFLAVSDRFMTPTAALADIIPPPAVFLEYDSIIAPLYYPHASLHRKAVHTPGARSDFDITTGLATGSAALS